MTRIKIEDLPEDMNVSKEEMRSILGGGLAYTNRFTDFQLSDPQMIFSRRLVMATK